MRAIPQRDYEDWLFRILDTAFAMYVCVVVVLVVWAVRCHK